MSRKVGMWIVAVVFAFQCSHYDELQKNGRESSHGSSESHNFGQDCMTCHNDPGSGAVDEGGWFNIAGSVHNEDGSAPYSDARVELWSQPHRQGTLYYSLEVDALGNFYTEKVVKYNGSCFPIVADLNSDEYEEMEPAFRGGGCNSCHGKTVDVIDVD